VRNGNLVNKDMVAVRVAPDRYVAVAASPDCFAEKPPWFPGHHLYYTNRRLMPPAFARVVEALSSHA
jgi:hypothetical protein